MALRDVTGPGLPWTQKTVEEMLHRHDPFHSIEAFIDSAELEEDQKAALWLLAWSEQGHLKRRGIVREALTATAQPKG